MPEGPTRENATAGSAVPSLRTRPPDPALLPSLAPLLRSWLPRQRWFAGKDRPVTALSLLSATELLPCPGAAAFPGLLHLLVRAEQPGPDPGRPGDADCYQLLLGVRPVLPAHLAPALIGSPSVGPLRGRTVYEALHDPRLAGLLLERLRIPGSTGSLRFVRRPATSIPSRLAPRPVTAEQSNSSVIYGDSHILKVFRRVGPGTNPELELPLALARAECNRVPHPTAWFETGTGAGTMTLGILQPFLSRSADGWQLALESLATRRPFTGPARALGRATAEVHTALAAALPVSLLRGPQTEVIARGMKARLETATALVPALAPYREGLHAAFDAFADLGRRGHTWAAQRMHGDLHLGQTLRSAPDGRWSIIDFEGEPARPIGERRRLHPVARDIAGMLRSFDYAARTHGDSPDEQQWSQEWARRGRAAYCDGYAEAAGTDPRDEPELLRAYETDKAVYEVVYEARHRPDWLPVPLAAVRRLAAGAPAVRAAPRP
ncbi:maltokinase N-terminal cap-like domain-containing protein [Streptomyces meridianus]|uniref:Maltokinase n=1 Tax=Streptomyces meridianus TaxID=2938945 RepID=A0ABT0X6F1_9ACTN|nr:maltokinase [Streptomyces meridianus]MCM2578110.1 maltokinase [Streptomyces meridianus]